MDKEYKILIIGAGLSGLTLAYELTKISIPFKIIEARNRIGGRIHTIRNSANDTIEMGATWFSNQHINLKKLALELDVKYEKQYTGEKVLYDYYNGKRTIQEIQLPPQNENSFIFSNGTIDLVNHLLNKIAPNTISFEEVVTSLEFIDELWHIKTNKNEFESKIIVNTLPPNLFLNTIQVLPELPSEYANNLSLTHTWMGESIKAGITLMNNQWRRNDLGSFFSQFGPITELHDHIHDNNQGSSMLMGFIDPVFHDLTPEARYQKVKEQLTLYFDPVDNTMVDYAELDWQNEEYSFFPYQSDVIPHQNNGSQILREPLFNSTLLMAGTETAKSFPGYMDGAVERANEIMSYLMKKIK